MTAPNYVVTPAAEADLVEIAAWLASHDRRAAERFLDAAYHAFDLLAERPRLGHRRRDLTARDVLFWPVQRRYLLIYDLAGTVRILRVLSGWRDVAAALAAEVP